MAARLKLTEKLRVHDANGRQDWLTSSDAWLIEVAEGRAHLRIDGRYDVWADAEELRRISSPWAA